MVAADPTEGHIERLSRDIHRLMWFESKRLAQILASYGLTIPQYFTLQVLRRGEGCSRMGDLAQKIHASSATMTGIVDRLEENGLVERVLDPADRRAIQVRVTERGTRMIEEVARAQCEQLAATLQQLAPDDRQQLARLIHTYLASLEAAATRAPERAE